MPVTPTEAPLLRIGARVLLLDRNDQVLLIHARDPDQPNHHWWELPGGGADPGESLPQTASRELAEETGIIIDHIGPHLWDRETRFHYRGCQHHRRESVYLARITDTAPTLRPKHTTNEKAGLIEHRWWTQPDLAACRDKLLPPNLPALLTDVLNGTLHQPVLLTSEINEVVGRIPPPATKAGWKKTMRERILAARRILLRHPWAPGVFQTRTAMGPAVLRYHDELVGQFRAGGFSYDLAHHSMHALGSRALGFTQELFDPGTGPGDVDPAQMEAMATQFPNLAGMLAEIVHDSPETTLGWCDDQTEFEFGLDVILDGLDRLRRTSRA